MPQFDFTIDFEVYCDTCGNGLCSETTVTQGRTRKLEQIRVNACPDCMSKKDEEKEEALEEKDEEIEDKNKEIEEKDRTIELLGEKIKQLETRISFYESA